MCVCANNLSIIIIIIISSYLVARKGFSRIFGQVGQKCEWKERVLFWGKKDDDTKSRDFEWLTDDRYNNLTEVYTV